MEFSDGGDMLWEVDSAKYRQTQTYHGYCKGHPIKIKSASTLLTSHAEK